MTVVRSPGQSRARSADLCVVVVSYQSASTIDDCLARLRVADGVDQIRVVDNGSHDATLEIVQRHASLDSRVRFIGNPDNPGFAVACNQGAGDGDAPWLLFLNPDCLPQADALSRLLAHARTCDGDVVLGAVLIDEAGVPDPAARRHDPDFAAMLSSARARELSIKPDPAAVLQQVEAVSGAVMLMRRSLFARIGGFDEGYRLHAEDLDLCRRARQAGARVLVANDVAIVHVRGVSSRARPLFVEWHKHRGLWRYFRKFEAARRPLATRVLVWCAIWFRFPLAALRQWLQSKR